jgi:beta-xylosidase
VPGKEYLLLTYDGELNIQAIFKFAPRILVAIQHHKCFRLVEDYRQATMKMNASDFSKVQHFQANTLEKIGVRFTRVIRAMVINEQNISREEMEFYKMLSINQGQDLSVFTDLHQAIDWILKEDSV